MDKVDEGSSASRVCADATALIGLARIDRLDLLTILPIPIYVTSMDWTEAIADPTKLGVAALHHAHEAGIISVVAEGDPDAFPLLDAGESTVISAAAARRASVILDERRARLLVNSDPVLASSIRSAIGVVGLILLAKRRGRIMSVKPLLDELIRQSFWIGAAFYSEVLRRAGE